MKIKMPLHSMEFGIGLAHIVMVFHPKNSCWFREKIQRLSYGSRILIIMCIYNS